METVKGRENFIIFVMVDDIDLEVDDIPDAMKKYIQTRTYSDAVNMKNQKDLDIFRKKLQYSMPQTALRDVPKTAVDQEGANPNFPPQFNRLNRYRNYNRGRNVRKVQLPDIEKVRKEADKEEQEAVL